MRPFVSDAQRRARLQHRQLLAGDTGASPEQLADAIVGLHATTPSTVHLSAWAREASMRPERLEAALYEDRSLVKHLVMRRTLFVMTRPSAPWVRGWPPPNAPICCATCGATTFPIPRAGSMRPATRWSRPSPTGA